jgi:hypothetical protein
MSTYIEKLRAELVAAAEREASRRVPARHRPRHGLLALAVAAAAVVVLAVVVGRSLLAQESRPASPASPAPIPQPGQLPGRPLYGGSLEGGVRYRSLNLRTPVSFVPGDDHWFVPDTSSMFFLFIERREPGEKPGGAYEDRLGGVGVGDAPTSLYDPDRPGRHEVAVHGNLARFLDRFPEVETSAPRPTQVAGLDGYSFRVRVDVRTRDHIDRECMRHFDRPCVRLGPDFWAIDGARELFSVLDGPRGPFAVTVEGLDAGRFERLMGPAEELLSTLRIGR